MGDLKVNIGKLSLKNPVMTASGTFGYGEEYADFIDLNRLGAIIVKGTTINHREGNPYPRMVETPSGMLNAVGLQNKGVKYFVNTIYPRIKHLDTEIIVNVSGAKVEDYVAVCEILNELDGINAIELNISCQLSLLLQNYELFQDRKTARHIFLSQVIKKQRLMFGRQ